MSNKSNDKLVQIKEIVGDWNNKAVEKIKAHPVKSVLIAAGVGAALGAVAVALFKRRN